jgi:hypothetical protein
LQVIAGDDDSPWSDNLARKGNGKEKEEENEVVPESEGMSCFPD